jgi:peptidoglycan-associated lipoprotein
MMKTSGTERRKLWIVMIIVTAVLALMVTSSCSKKKVRKKQPADQAALDDAAQKEAERLRLEEEALEEERLRKEREAEEMIMKAREAFTSEDIYFSYDSAALTPAAQELLTAKAEWLRENAMVEVIIEGHTDSRGTVEYNLSLGERRAESAKSFLVDLGIDSSRLTTISYGEERPMDPTENEMAWTKNRRAHFVLQ